MEVAMQLASLSKLQLVELGRMYDANMGDYARQGKDELIVRILRVAPNEDTAYQRWVTRFNQGTVAALVGPTVPQLQQMSAAPALAFVAPTYPDLEVILVESAAKVFNMGQAALKNIKVDVWNDPGAPKVNPHYRFNPQLLQDALVSLRRQRPIWLAGPAGTGKTEFVKQLCARTGRAFVRVQFDASLEAYHIVGGERVKAASTVWQDGLVLQGYRHPGAIILLDEVGFARPEYTSSLHAAIEPDGVITVAETGEVVNRAPGVCFMAADNSNGRGDPSGVYVGVREQNNAFLSRFAKTLMFGYMEAEEEALIIADVSGAPASLARLIADFIAVCRAKADTGMLESPPTMREAFYLAEDLTDGVPARRAFENTIVHRSPLDCHEVLQQLWAANVDADMVRRAAAGEVVSLKTTPAHAAAPAAAPQPF